MPDQQCCHSFSHQDMNLISLLNIHINLKLDSRHGSVAVNQVQTSGPMGFLRPGIYMYSIRDSYHMFGSLCTVEQ